MCVLIFFITFVWNNSHSKHKRPQCDKKKVPYIGPHVKHPLFFSNFSELWTFCPDIRKILSYQNAQKIRLVGAEVFHAEGQRDMTKLIVAVCSFANASKNRTYFQTLKICLQ